MCTNDLHSNTSVTFLEKSTKKSHWEKKNTKQQSCSYIMNFTFRVASCQCKLSFHPVSCRCRVVLPEAAKPQYLHQHVERTPAEHKRVACVSKPNTRSWLAVVKDRCKSTHPLPRIGRRWCAQTTYNQTPLSLSLKSQPENPTVPWWKINDLVCGNTKARDIPFGRWGPVQCESKM